MQRKVEVVPPSPLWSKAFVKESQQVARALGENLVNIHHIGSTAIPNIYAKPIIDMLVEVRSLESVDEGRTAIESLGYEVLGEFGIPGRRFCRKDNAEGLRTHHIHIFLAGSAQVERHLAFRDYLSTHPAMAQAYSDLKRSLAAKFPTDISGYMDGKDAFIQEMDRQAAQRNVSL
jgi:GrpB-like predicted nucleotidyltransferase (UPF0157 family)